MEISQTFWATSSNAQPLQCEDFSPQSATVSLIALCCLLSFCYVLHKRNFYLTALIYVTEDYRSIPSFILFFFSSIRHCFLRPFIALSLICQHLSYTVAPKIGHSFPTALQYSILLSTMTKGITTSLDILAVL